MVSSLVAGGVTSIVVSPFYNRGFLPTAGVSCAFTAYSRVSAIILGATNRPSAVLFDIDGTLQREGCSELIGRTVGAMFAFANLGIPVGIYSIRPFAGVRLFLSGQPIISELLAMGRERQLERMVFSNKTYVNVTVALCGQSKCVDLRLRQEQSRVDPTSSLTIPRITISTNGKNVEIIAPKFSPRNGVVLVDDKDYSNQYSTLLEALKENGEKGNSLYNAALSSLQLLWHVGNAGHDENFSSEQLGALEYILHGI